MQSLPVVAVVGTCDTKYQALLYVKHVINSGGLCKAILIDIGSYDPVVADGIDIPRSQVLNGLSEDPLDMYSRGAALGAMSRALTLTLSRLQDSGEISGVIGAGGSGNTSACTAAFRDALRIGFPKLMVSTMASGNISPYVGETDLTMMYSVVDVARMNPLLEMVLANAAHAIAGMTWGTARRSTTIEPSPRPMVAATMFGVTTPCVNAASAKLEELGYSVIVFHATGSGGRAMENLIRQGRFVGVLDITTTELVDHLVGGVCSAGSQRLDAAAAASVPQLVSVGALDMVNFGTPDTVPTKFADRVFVQHNPSITIMRTTPEECARVGKMMAEKLNNAPAAKTHVLLPLQGVSALDKDHGPFRDAEADEALFDALRRGLRCPVEEVDAHINDISFALTAALTLHGLIQSAT